MAILGSHMSIAGGYHRAVEAARSAGCDCVQLFTKNNNQWRGAPITESQANRFRESLAETGITHPLSHASYLINLASPDEELRQKSIAAMVVELERAGLLGIPWVVVHPGSFTTGNEADGIRAIGNSLDAILEAVPNDGAGILLENTAGQGSNLGWQFSQLREMLVASRHRDRIGVCIDTCHAFAAGFPLATPSDWNATVAELDRAVGLDRVKAFHLNDSKQPFGSRKDRHEHIGQGEMGLEPFRNLLNDRRFLKIPMYLETEKGTDDEGRDFDVVNLETLRSLIL
jgi:deoxyribonuclease IV